VTHEELFHPSLSPEFTSLERMTPKVAAEVLADPARFGELPARLARKLRALYTDLTTRRQLHRSRKRMAYTETRHPSAGRPGSVMWCPRVWFRTDDGRTITYPAVPVDSHHLWLRQLLGERGVHPVWGDISAHDRIFADVDLCPHLALLEDEEIARCLAPWMVVIHDLAAQADERIRFHVLSSTKGFWLQTWFWEWLPAGDMRRLWTGISNLVTWRADSIVRGTVVTQQALGTEVISQWPDATSLDRAGCRTWGSPAIGSDSHSTWYGFADLGAGGSVEVRRIGMDSASQVAHTLAIEHVGRVRPILELLESELPPSALEGKIGFSGLHRLFLGGLESAPRRPGGEHGAHWSEPLEAAVEAVLGTFEGSREVGDAEDEEEAGEGDLDDEGGAGVTGQGGLLPNSIAFNLGIEGDAVGPPGRPAAFDALARSHLPVIESGEAWSTLIVSGSFGRLVAHAMHLGLVDEPGFWLEDLAAAIVERLAEPTAERRQAVDDFVACCHRQIRAGTFPFVWPLRRVELPRAVLDACWLMGHLLKDRHAKRLSGFEAWEIERLLEEVVTCRISTGELGYSHGVMAGWCGWVAKDRSNASAAAQRMRRLHLKLVVGLDDRELVEPLMEVASTYRPPWDAEGGAGYSYRGLWDRWEDPVPAFVRPSPSAPVPALRLAWKTMESSRVPGPGHAGTVKSFPCR